REWQPRIDDSKRGVREQDASFEMNEPDAYALEESLRLREKHGGEVVACTAGPARASQVWREAPIARYTSKTIALRRWAPIRLSLPAPSPRRYAATGSTWC